MRIILKREVPVHTYSVGMSVYISEEKPEIFPLLKAVEEANEQNKNTVVYLNQTLFPGFSIKFVENVLEELRLLDLIDFSHKLTERGIETLDSKIVLTPDEGAYEIKVVEDIFLPQVIIEMKPLDPDLKKELWGSTASEQISKLEIPNFLLGIKGNKIKTLEQKPQTVSIHEINKKGSINKQFTKKLSLILTYDDGTWKANAIINKRSFQLPLIEEFDSNLVIDQLLKIISSDADLINWQIPQKIDKLETIEITGFLKNFKKDKIIIENLGKFDEANLFDVTIFPDSQESAEKWAKTLFIEKKCTDYIIGTQFSLDWNSMIEEYYLLTNFELSVPERKAISKELYFGSQKFWFLNAPEDMLLEEIVLND